MLKLGDVRYQISWVRNVAAMAAGFHLFSAFAGDAEGVLSATFLRLVVGFKNLSSHFWIIVGDFININLKGFEEELTFTSLTLSPYLIFIKKVRIGGFFDDGNKILSSLNFFCFMFIANIFGSGISPHYPKSYEVAIAIFPFLMVFAAVLIYRACEDFSYRRKLKAFVFIIIILLLFWIFKEIIYSIDEIVKIDNLYLWLSVLLVYNFAYAVCMFFRLDGYYPLLFCCIFYFLYSGLNLALSYAPLVDQYLSSIGV